MAGAQMQVVPVAVYIMSQDATRNDRRYMVSDAAAFLEVAKSKLISLTLRQSLRLRYSREKHLLSKDGYGPGREIILL